MLKGFKIGHKTDAENGTGVTVIISEKGATGGVSVRGSAPATRETDLLKSEKTVGLLNAVVLSGGSAFGLEAASGVQKYLFDKGVGYDAGKYKVPIVAAASLYDLEYGNFAYPCVSDGYEAAESATEGNFESGEIGAAAGATVGKLMGMASAAKTKLGVQTYSINGLEIAVIVAVNALGDIVRNGKVICGVKAPDGSYLDSEKIMTAGGIKPSASNTTIGAVLTNAKLTKVEANILADLAHDGLARAIRPSHTRYDGDAFFCMASNEKNSAFDMLTALVPPLTESAIHSAVEGTTHVEKRVSPFLYSVFKKMWK